MAVAYCSLFKITLAPGTPQEQVLLDYGDRMEAEPAFTITKQVSTIAYLRGSDVKTIDRGNRSNTIVFSIVKDHSSNVAAREYVIDHNITAQDFVSNTTVRIDVKGSTSYRTIEDVNLTFTPASYGKDVHNTKARTIYTYTITGGKISKATI